MNILSIEKLCKRYESFHLKDVSFSLEAGYIMGFIGSNGAGKTTTLKSILGLVHADSGAVSMFGKDFSTNEQQLKQQIGFIFGGVDYYPKTCMKKITHVFKRFYSEWDNDIYARYMQRFGLDENKKITELSHGMRVKYALTLALSHHAKLFILDEPTSGLDPVARDGLLELFQELIEDGNKSILFSTHITSDLEKCADYITYIEGGQIIASTTKDNLIASYRIVKGTHDQMDAFKHLLIACKMHSFGFTGLIKTSELPTSNGLITEPPTLDDIMIYHANKEATHEATSI